MEPTAHIKGVATAEAARFVHLARHDGFKGGKLPVRGLVGWFVRIDGQGAYKELLYERDGMELRYIP